VWHLQIIAEPGPSQHTPITHPSTIQSTVTENQILWRARKEPWARHSSALAEFSVRQRLHKNWQSDECYRGWMQVLWELMEGLGKTPLNKEYWTSRWNDGELVEQGVGKRAPQAGETAYIKPWLGGNVWCQALKEVQGGREIRVRRNTRVTHGRSWTRTWW